MVMGTIIELVLEYLLPKVAELVWRLIIRHFHRKIKARPASKSGDKSGTDCPNAGITSINITYNYNICDEHCHPPCAHSGKTARRRRRRSGRRRSLR